MNTPPAELYLDLLKKTLTFSLWPEPPLPITTFNYARPAWKRAMINTAERLASLAGLELMKKRHVNSAERSEGRNWPSYADTMIGLRRLDNLHACIESVLAGGVTGDLIETGVWRGGAGRLMRGVPLAYGVGGPRGYVAYSVQ